MKKSVYFFGLSICILFASCIKEIEFDSEESASKIVLNSRPSPDSVFSVHISKSLNVLDQAPESELQQAIVGLFDGNGNFIEQLVHVSDGFYRSPSGLLPVQGQTYRIEASHNGFEAVSASTLVPAKVLPTVMDTSRINISGNDYLKINLSFNDPSGENDFYALKVYQANFQINYDQWGNPSDTIFNFYEAYLSSNNMYFEDAGGIQDWKYSLYLRDAFFNGQSVNLEIYTPEWNEMPVHAVYLVFSRCSEDYYKYSRTLDLHKETLYDPFAQPVQIYSNVEKGIGVFAGYAPYIVQIK